MTAPEGEVVVVKVIKSEMEGDCSDMVRVYDGQCPLCLQTSRLLKRTSLFIHSVFLCVSHSLCVSLSVCLSLYLCISLSVSVSVSVTHRH